jgi:hypothetical protein
VLSLLRVPCLDSSAFYIQPLVNQFQNGNVCERLCISEFATTSEHGSTAVRLLHLLNQVKKPFPNTHVSELTPEMQSPGSVKRKSMIAYTLVL